MRRFVRIMAAVAALGALAAGAATLWRRNRRVGTGFVNSVVNPGLLRRGLAGGRASEIGTLEHIGRTSGILRLTPVHPEPTSDGFRIVAPLGMESQWARNVIAAGHCRLQLHDTVYDLDEPKLVPAADVDALPRPVRRLMAALGFEYLTLRTFATNPGTLEPISAEAFGPVEAAPVPEPRTEASVPA